jgi:hypothetical protein
MLLLADNSMCHIPAWKPSFQKEEKSSQHVSRSVWGLEAPSDIASSAFVPSDHLFSVELMSPPSLVPSKDLKNHHKKI